MSQVSQPKKEFKLQARRFHIVANEKVLPELQTVLQYIMSRQYIYILCRKGLNKKGKEHAHIYVAFERPVRLSTRNTHGCYLAKCRGDSKQNVTYINDHHPELIIEKGTLPENDGCGREEAWKDYIKSIHEGKVDKDSMFYARFEGYTNRRLAELKPKKRFEGNLKDKNLWIWSRGTGMGKSYWSERIGDYYDKAPNKWWDGYKGEKIVRIEELDPENCKYIASYLKRWADYGQFTAAMKGSAMKLNPADYNLIVTSNFSIDECFENERDARAIKRRFEEWELTEPLPNTPSK